MAQMHAATCPAPGSAHRQRVRNRSLLLLIGLLPFLPMVMAVQSGCTATEEKAVQAKAQAFNAGVKQDAQSPAGQKLLADLTSDGLSEALTAIGGGTPGEIAAGVQALANVPGIVRDFKALPTAPSSTTATTALASSPTTAKLATTLGPVIAQLVANGQKSAQVKNVSLTKNDILEAVARGMAAAPAAKYVPPVTSTSTGEAP